ncbi:MAG: hypothetical protein GAK38_00697 [Xylophilus sp.]|nr:MAG: hypothetical protein GAK38_00697 [Xylophilus sp.]
MFPDVGSEGLHLRAGQEHYEGVTTTIAFKPNGELKNAAITLYAYRDGVRTLLN